MMRFVTTNDIENWAKSVECRYHLPHLIRKLIIATLDNYNIKNINFPYGEDVQIGGYDGELLTDSENLFVPLGESVWEFGTTNAKGKKANEDYDKRKQNTLGKVPSETTYININAKKYRDKVIWASEKQKEGFWSDVKYYDAIDIEQWLELAPTVELWLAEKLRKPTLGIFTVEEYWKRWSENKSVKIIPDILLGDSRSIEIEKVKTFLNNDEGVLYIKSITIDEATAFPLAIFKKLEDEDEGITTSKIVIIDNRESFIKFTQTNDTLVIISKFKIDGIELSGAIQRGHKVIIPISLSDEINSSEKIQLPIISIQTFEDGLLKMGIDSEQAKLLTKNSGRNISVLKRLLKFADVTNPKYIENVDIKDLLPILLLNRFNENSEGDREIVELLSNKTYNEYIQFLKNLALLEDSPIYHINGVWRLISPTDTWLYFSKFLTEDQLLMFHDICMQILGEVLHKYNLPLEERNSLIFNSKNKPRFSSSIKKGVCESLVLISVFGEEYGIDSIPSTVSYTNQIVNKVLSINTDIWRSLSQNLMILAEAAPEVFLNNLERIIEDKSFTSFFELEQGLINTSNDLAPILWCLDIIAWFPDHIMRVSNILCEIISISPESFPTTNTPLNNLNSIFRIWYPQTNSNAEERKIVLNVLKNKYSETIYKLFIKLIDRKFDTAFHTPRPKWRLFSELRKITVSQREVYYMTDFCIDEIIVMSKDNMLRILQLIELIDDVQWSKIDFILEMIQDSQNLSITERTSIFHQFRKIISHHKSYPDAVWALPANVIDKIEQVALKFKPEDNPLNDIYIFEEFNPQFIEGNKENDFKIREEKLLAKRIELLNAIIFNFGIDKVFELALNVEHSFLFGNVLAYINDLNKENKLIIYKQVESDDIKMVNLASSFIRISESKTSLRNQTDVLEELISEGISSQGINNFLNSLRDRNELWMYIENLKNVEIEENYWKSKNRFLYTDTKDELFYAISKLQTYKKPFTLINTLGWGTYSHKNELNSYEVLKALENVDFNDFDDTSKFDYNNFKHILEFLYSKDDYEIEDGAKVEMKFIFAFSGGSYSPKPKNLYLLMSQKPEEYFGIIEQVYLPDEEELRNIELDKLKENPHYYEIFKVGWEILDSFNLIPSLKEDGTLDVHVFKKWMNDVRELAKNKKRVEITDDCLGKLLAKYPINMKEGIGYPLEIYDVLEEVNTKEIIRAFSAQIYNKLGFTSRGAFEGGNIERHRSNYFNSLFEATKLTHPRVSQIFRDLRDHYAHEAKGNDDEALLRSLE